MNLRQRFAELLQIITKDIPEREYYVQLGFLTALIQEPFYLYGRPGCGSSLFIRRISSAFKDARVLKLGKKQRQLPDNINDFNLIIFDNFTPNDELSKSNLQIVIHDHEKNSIIISGDQKPESALSRSEVSDQVTLTIMLPDSISSDALCKLLQIHGTDSNVIVPPSIAISAEEQAEWIQALSKVTLSPNTLAVIGKVAETCEKNCVYVPIRRWLALSNMIKAIAFLNGRTETKLIDTFFLGTSIWGRSASNTAISESYKQILKEQLYKIAWLAHFRISAIKPWPVLNDIMARLMMNEVQMDFGLEPTFVADEKEYRKTLAAAIREDIADIFVNHAAEAMGSDYAVPVTHPTPTAPKAPAEKPAAPVAKEPAAKAVSPVGKDSASKAAPATGIVPPVAKSPAVKTVSPAAKAPKAAPAADGKPKTRDIILELLSKHPTFTTADLAGSIGISTKGIEKHLARLKAEGVLKRIGPDKGGHWQVG